MECWSIGLVELDLFLDEGCKPENKNRPSSVFDPQFSITPLLHHSMGYLTAKITPPG
jgi:hypothetical protein